jgi:hypothetical protein
MNRAHPTRDVAAGVHLIAARMHVSQLHSHNDCGRNSGLPQKNMNIAASPLTLTWVGLKGKLAAIQPFL